MKAKRIWRVILWLLPALLAVASWPALLFVGEETELRKARTLLLAGDEEGASAAFERLRDSLLAGARARAGLAVCGALAAGAEPGVSAPGAPEVDAAPFSLPLLMMREMRAGRFERCLALAGLAEAWGEPTAGLFRAAALLETERDDEAAVIWRTLRPPLRLTMLGRRLGQALELRRAGAVTIVRDHGGRLAGIIDASGVFGDLEGLVPELIPPAVVEELARAGGAAGRSLSIDLELSELARAALEGYCGSVVLLDPRSGGILAAVSDAETLRGGGTPALEQRLEPASITKIVTLTAALRAGIDADAEIAAMTCEGAHRFEGGILYCLCQAGQLRGLNHAMATSCNIAFARLGVSVGWDDLLAEFRRYGFDAPEGDPFAMGAILIDSGSERRLADLAIGLEAADITPLHAALIAAAVAGEGVLPTPELIAGVDGALGLSPRAVEPRQGRRMLERDWLPTLVLAMVAVTGPGGTAAWVAPFGFPVAMKTGTGGDRRRGYHVNYIGFGPLLQPRVAFCIRVTGQETSPQARDAGYEVTRRLLAGLERTAAQRGW